MNTWRLWRIRSKWRKILPNSKLVYPDRFLDKLKFFFWQYYTPLHPLLRNLAVTLHIVKHTGRQEYLVGIVAPHETIESVAIHLLASGFGNDFVAWRDEGEVVSLRKLVDFSHQYHIRIFYDGEVRGHYEYTPEAAPLMHMEEEDFTDARDVFLAILGDRVIEYVPNTTRF